MIVHASTPSGGHQPCSACRDARCSRKRRTHHLHLQSFTAQSNQLTAGGEGIGFNGSATTSEGEDDDGAAGPDLRAAADRQQRSCRFHQAALERTSSQLPLHGCPLSLLSALFRSCCAIAAKHAAQGVLHRGAEPLRGACREQQQPLGLRGGAEYVLSAFAPTSLARLVLIRARSQLVPSRPAAGLL